MGYCKYRPFLAAAAFFGILSLLFPAKPAIGMRLDKGTQAIIGDRLALKGFERLGFPVADEVVQKYVNLVGTAVAREIGAQDQPLYFAVIETTVPAAFACPGGVILVGSALFLLMEDEAELASVLAHEIANVRENHLFRSLDSAEQAKISTFNGLIEALAGILYEKGLKTQFLFTADRAAMMAAYRTGYDPGGLIRLLERLASVADKTKQRRAWMSDGSLLTERIRQAQHQLSQLQNTSEMARVQDRFQRYRSQLMSGH